MEVQDKKLAFDRDLWVQYGGVDVSEDAGRIVLTGRDEDGYLKVFNHFGRLLKLYVFEGGRWIDADTGGAPQRLDESQAGHLPAAKAPPAEPRSGSAAPEKGAASQHAGAQRSRKPAPPGKSAAKAPGKTAKRGKTAGKAAKAGTEARGKRT